MYEEKLAERDEKVVSEEKESKMDEMLFFITNLIELVFPLNFENV